MPTMDNQEQIKEIVRYRQYLCRVNNSDVDLETAALLWISKFANAWRKLHNYPQISNR